MSSLFKSIPNAFMNYWNKSTYVKPAVLAASAILSDRVGGLVLPFIPANVLPGPFVMIPARLIYNALPVKPLLLSHLATAVFGFGLAASAQGKQAPAQEIDRATFWRRAAKTTGYIAGTFLCAPLSIAMAISKNNAPANELANENEPDGAIGAAVENRLKKAFSALLKTGSVSLIAAATGLTAASIFTLCGNALLQEYAMKSLLAVALPATAIWTTPSLAQQPEFASGAAWVLTLLSIAYPQALLMVTAAAATAKLGLIVKDYFATSERPVAEPGMIQE